MRKIMFLLAVSLVSILQPSCKKDSSPAPNSSSVMFVNGSAGTVKIDVTAGGKAVNGATNLDFLRNSGYQSLTAGNNLLSFILSATGTPLDTATADFAVNGHYSVFLGGLVNHTTRLILSDDLSAPASGNAGVRFVNLSNDSMSVSASVGTTSVATGVHALGYSGFIQVPAGSYIIKAGDPGNISTVVQTSSQTLSAGKLYTVMLTGTITGTGTSGLTLTVINNN